MSVTVVVGGQFGGEGKGKICAHLALAGDVDFMVRCGGPNSGHTVHLGDIRYQLRQVPAGFVNPRTRLLLAAGALIDPRVFLREVELCGLRDSRVGIDGNAGVIEESDVEAEQALALRERLGSTGTGVGSAVSRRVLRDPGFRLAKDVPELRPFTTCVRDELVAAVERGCTIVVEGTQGFGLSLYHASEWPYRTSRDTTAHSFLGEVGLGVREFEVIMAIRTYPIRVGGNSGPLLGEITWEELRRRSGYPFEIAEYTTTTGRLRRVAEFNWDVVEQAVAANAPSCLALHGADYLDYRNKSATSFQQLTSDTLRFIRQLEDRLGVPVRFIGTGPRDDECVDRRAEVHEASASCESSVAACR
ncbi:MAG: adenylosuccinate synthetase [Chloroflexi bacterium]|nr:adenylosuccinate synthetase [Chloroflexota bacterium]